MSINRYALFLSALVIAVTLVSLLLPKGKTQKAIKTVLSLVIVISVFKPVSYFLGKADFTEDYAFLSVQDNFSYYANEKYATLNETACEKLLESYGVKSARVHIMPDDTAEFFSTKLAEIDLTGAVIISESENIDIKEEVKKAVSEFLRIDIKAVTIIE